MEELEAIVQRMIDAGETEDNIKTVIEGYEVEDGGFDPNRYVPGVAGDILTGPLYAYEKILQAGQGLTNIADNLIKNIETGQEPEWLTRKLAQMSVIGGSPKAVEAVVKSRKKVFDIYTNHVVDMVQQGASRELIQETDPTNVVKLEPLINWFERTLPAPKIDKETGEAVDYLKLYGDGKIIQGTDAFMSDVAGAVPSILISRIPVLGPTLLGASTYMGEFEDELIKRAKDPEFNLEEDLDNLIQNALITGGADVVLETVGGSLLNKIPGMQLGKETVKEILTEAPKQLLKKSGLGFLSEFATEGATGVVTDLADVVSFGDDVKPVKDYLRTFVKDGFVGGFLGGTVTSVGGVQNKNKIYEYVSPQTYKQEQLGLSSSILTLEQDKQKASSKDKKYFDTKIQELKNKKESNQKNLYTFFDNSTEKEKVEYASNIDKQNEALDVIGNKNFSELAQQEAEQDLRKYTEANNKFFDVTDVDYDAGLEQEIGLKIKAAQRIAEKRGAFGFNNKNLNVVELNTAEEVEEVASKIPGADTADGIFLGENKDGKSTIYINNPVAIAKGSTNVLGHEYLHAIISKAFKTTGIGNENLSVAAKSFVDYLNSIGEQRIVERVEKRLAKNYGGLDADGNIVRDENGLVKTDKKQDQEEYFNLFSDLISKEKIKNVEEKSGGIKNAFRQLFVGLGFSKVDFKDGKQVFDFLVDYNANMERAGILGKFVSKRIAKTKMTGLEATAAEKAAMDQIKKESRTGYEKTARDQRIDAIGEQSTKAEWDAGGADMAISDMYMSGDLEAIVRNNLSSDLKNLPNYSEEDFISETIGELMPHIKNFNIDKKETQKGFGLSGWIRGQISNKIGNVLKKKKATTETFTVDTTDEKVKETVEATDALEDLQEEDISISAQAKKKAKAERREEKGMEADVEYSTFRRALKVKGKQGLSDNIVNDVKKAVVKTMATERTTPDSDKFIANIKKSFLTELKKPIQDMMGKKDDFTDFLKTNREAIIAALPTSTLVQMERNVNPEDRTFTVEIKRNLSPTETDDAIANDQLPKDTNRNSGPTLYAKRMPSEGEFLRYFNPPLYVPSKKDPNKFVRSGLKGTRKDTLAEQMGIELAFDATMEVVQSPEVAERRSLVTNTDFLETGLDQLARSIGRGIDIKFSRSNPVEIEFKMDLALDNVNTDAYLDIRFSKSSRDAYIKRLVKNRPDLKGKEEQYVDSVFDWLETTNIKKRSKYEKMAMHYMAKGYLILPEDGYKVIEAERLAAIKKIDPFSVGNPNEIIEKYAGTVKGARTNPDTVKEFSNKKDLGNGIVTYDVEQTKEGQLAVREVIDTHFGKKSNPWCLASRDNRLEQAYAEFNNKEQANIKARELESQGYDVEVALIDGTYEVYGDLIAKPGNDMELNAAFTMWEKYQEGGKGYQVVFTNGKLSHFKDGSGKYWDKMDEPSNYISKKLSDLKLKDGFTQERYLNVNTGEQVLGDKSRVTGNRQDGTYTETTIKSTPTFGETVEIEEVRKNGELTYQKKLTTNNDESYGTETKYYKDSKTVTNTKSHPKGLKKGGSPLWALETTLDRAGKIAGVDLKLDKYTETSLVNDYKGTTTGSYNRVGSKHTVKGELNGKNATVEIFQSVGVNEDTNIAKVKVNGKTVYTAPKVDDTGIKFSRHRVEQASYRLKRKGVSSLDLNNPDDSLAFFLYAKRKKEEYENVYTIPDVAKVLDEDIKDSKGTQLSNALKLELVSLRNFVNAVKLHKDGPIQVVLEDVVADKTPDNLISVFEENVGIEDKADTFRTPARTFFWVKNKTNDNYKVLINKPENLASQSPRKLDKLRKMMEAKLKAQDQIKVIESVIGRKWNGTEDKLTVEEHDALINDSRFDLAYVQVQAKTDFAVHDYLKMGKKKPIASSYINVGTAGAMTMGNADPLELGSIIPRFEGRPMALVMRQIFEKSENGKKYSIKFKVEGQMRVNDKRKNGKPVFVKSRINFYIQEDVSRVVNEFNNRRGILKDATSYRDATPKEVEKLANFKFSKSKDKPNIKEIVASSKINEMIERSKGIPAQEIISGAGARRSGKNKNPFQFFVPPSADDLSGLLYYLAGKGKQGEADLKFMKQFLLDPLGKGERSLATKKQQIITDYKELKKELTDTHKKLKTLIPDSKYTYDTAVRVFLWNQEGYDIPDISDKEVGVLIDIVRNDAELQEYAQKLASIGSNYEGKYPEPIEDWIVGSTAKDLYDVTTKVGRKLFLSEFSENSNAFFTKDNINKLTAAYGVEYTEALEDMLYRIKTGENRPKSISEGDRNTKRFMNWVTNSTGAIMFFNSRSAVLQTLSTVNYLNWSDNNPLLAGKAFANQKQFWTDFAMIFNSDMLKQRRSGLSTDIQAAEIASAAATAKNKANAAIAYLLKKGFLPTQMADSFAISAGGAAFYRNRVNSYVKQGMDQKAAEEKAFADFADITEENQQSSRPDRVSQQQASPLGRLILAFQNTPMQYNRIIKKAMLDLQSGRGDTKTNVSKIIYYAGAQAFVFASLQNALFAMLFDDEDEDKSREEILKETEKEQLKLTRVINSMIDGLLNGSGVKGRVMSTIKNTILKFIEEDSKEWNANYTELAVEAAQLSPPIGSKLRKIAKAGENYGWNKKVIKEIGYDNYFNPAYVTAATFAEAATNVPLARVVRKLDNLVDAADQNNRAWQRVGLLMGWSQWDMGIEGKRRQVATEAKEEIKKKKKEKKKEERKAKEKRCSAIKSNGKRCKNITTNKSGRCYAHD